MKQNSKSKRLVDTLIAHGHKIYVYETPEGIIWETDVDGIDEEVDVKLTGYLLSEGWLDKWYTPRIVQSALKDAFSTFNPDDENEKQDA